MGKRELLIVAAFVCVGALAYHLTAPAPKAGERRFSLTGLAEAWRGRGQGNRMQASVTTNGVIAVGAALTEVSAAGAVTVVVAGEPRADIAWSLRADAAGPDEAAARAVAQEVRLEHDDLGSVVTLTVRPPRGGRQAATLTLRVPARLTVRLDAPRRSTVARVAAVRFDNAGGDADVQDVAGAVTGTLHNGTLSIARAGSVAVTIQGGSATVTDTRGDSTITFRNGMLHVIRGAGSLTLDAANAFVDVSEPAGPVRATTAAGSVTVTDPRADVRVDARTSKVSASLDRAVPVTAIATGGTIRVALDDRVPITIDAVADGGTITATDLGLTADHGDRGATLHAVLGGATRVALRSDGGEIVIAKGK